jgi:hypothetical protein
MHAVLDAVWEFGGNHLNQRKKSLELLPEVVVIIQMLRSGIVIFVHFANLIKPYNNKCNIHLVMKI